MSKTVSNEKIIAALLSSGTISEAAAKLKISSRTIYSRMGTKDFLAAYSAAKSDLIRDALIGINRRLSAAVETVSAIMTDDSVNPAIRLQAARTLLSNAARLSDSLQNTETLVFKCTCSEWDEDIM